MITLHGVLAIIVITSILYLFRATSQPGSEGMVCSDGLPFLDMIPNL